MVRDVLYAYSIDENIRAYTYAVVFYFGVRMHRRNAVRAVGGGLLAHHALLLRFEISPIQSFCFDNLP